MSDPRDWDLEYDGAAPPLPREMERKRGRWRDRGWADLVQTLLPEGSYLVWFEPRIPEEFEPRVSLSEGMRLPKLFSGIFRVSHRLEPLAGYNPVWRRPRRWMEQRRRSLLTSGSGDLYSCDRSDLERLVEQGVGSGRDGWLEVLPFRVEDYRYYLRAETLWVTAEEASGGGWPSRVRRSLEAFVKGEKKQIANGLVLGLDTHFYDSRERRWQSRQSLTLRLARGADAAGSAPSSGQPGDGLVENLGSHAGLDEYRAARVFNSLGTEVGIARLARVSKLVRNAFVQVHCLEGLPQEELRLRQAPWKETFGPAGWQVEVSESIRPIPRQFGMDRGGWSLPVLQEYHEKAIAREPQQAEEARWVYHLLVVDRMEGSKKDSLGYMYDLATAKPSSGSAADGGDRQGAVVAWDVVKAESPQAGSVSASGPEASSPARLQAEMGTARADGTDEWRGLLYWTALHEFGHMLGLYHNPSNRSLLQPRHYRDLDFNPETDFDLAEQDKRRLWHLPDLWVRPEGVPFSHRYRKAPVDIVDLMPSTRRVDLEIEPQVVTSGTRLRPLKLTFINQGPPLYIPRQPERSGLRVTSRQHGAPTVEIVGPRFPRLLTKNEERNHPGGRLDGELALPPEPWDRAGTYDLTVHLYWISRHSGKLHHLAGTTRIRVVS